MSLQDETYPDDFFDELDFSLNSNDRIQFPNAKRISKTKINIDRICRTQNRTQDGMHTDDHYDHNQERGGLPEDCDCNEVKLCGQNHIVSSSSSNVTNISTLSPNDSEQDLSSESNNGRPPSESSDKTTESDPTGLACNVNDFKKLDLPSSARNSRAASYLDIHKEYTKRRFKHVESKVGQYIASIKAEEKKRRSNATATFQRHKSMPETYCKVNRRSELHGSLPIVHSESVLYKSNQQDFEAKNCLNRSTTAPTNMPITASTSTKSWTTCNASEESRRCQSSSTSSGFVDKLTYTAMMKEKARIESYSEHLQMKLGEKIEENMLLKRDVDYFRIELNKYEDKLKRQTSLSGLGGSGNLLGIGYSHRLSHHTLLSLYAAMKSTKSTQTEFPSPNIPISPKSKGSSHSFDANNNTFDTSTDTAGSGKKIDHNRALNFQNIVELQNRESNVGRSDNEVIHLRSISNSSENSAKPAMTNSSDINRRQLNDNSRCPSSSDSAIDIESVELASSPHCHQHERRALQNLNAQLQHPQQQQQREQQQQTFPSHCEEFCCDQMLGHDNHGKRSDQPLSASPGLQLYTASGRRREKKENSLRRRWLRMFVPCTRCNDPNQSLTDASYTLQYPLLEKSTGSHCTNISTNSNTKISLR